MRIKRESRWLSRQNGQATVEFLALLPLTLFVIAACWQLVVAGQAIWLAGGSASAAARADAIGGGKDELLRSARSKLPAALDRHVRVSEGRENGTVRLELDIPSVIGEGSITTIKSEAHFEPQGG